MVEEKKLSVGEMKRTIATSLGTAFGLVIGLLWNNVVNNGLNVAHVNTSLESGTLNSWLAYLITAVALTIVMVVLIIVVSRWGSK